MKRSGIFACALAGVFAGTSITTWAQSTCPPGDTPISYQGYLKESGIAPTGAFNICFEFWSGDCGSGMQFGTPICLSNVQVTSGLFSVILCVPAGTLPTDPYLPVFMQAVVRGEVQCPRQPIVPAPLANRSRFSVQTELANVAVVAGNIEGDPAVVLSPITFTNPATFTTPTPFILQPGTPPIPDMNASLLNNRDEAFLRNASNLNAGTMSDARLSGNVPRLNAAQTFSGANTFNSASNSFTGTHSGNGANLTSLNAGNISAGTLADGRLSTNVPLLAATQTFSGANTFAAASNSFTGSGSGLTALNATNLSSGTLPDARFAGTYSNAVTLSNSSNNVTGTHSGSGAGLTALNAGNISAGTLADSRLSTNVATLSGTQTFSGAKTFSSASNSFSGNGAGLTALNASNLSSGTLPDGRLAGIYTSAVTFNNASSSFSGAFSGTHSGNGSALSNLSAGSVTGTLSDGVLSSNIPRLNAAQTFTGNVTFNNASSSFAGTHTGTHSGNGSALTSLNASNISTGTLADQLITSAVARRGGGSTPATAQDFSGVHHFVSPDDDTEVFVTENNYGIIVSCHDAGDVAFVANAAGGIALAAAGLVQVTANDNEPALSVISAVAPVGFGGAVKSVCDTGRAGYFETSASSTYALRAVANATTPYAGWFTGRVSVDGLLTADSVDAAIKAFRIDHPADPENKYLMHSCVESAERKNVYDGVVTLDQRGEATVELPDWFEALNRDFRYQLTCIGGHAPVFIAEEVKDGAFTIAGGRLGLKVSWQVTGVRQDAYARAHPLVVESEKESRDIGRYLHPEVYGKPASARIDPEPAPDPSQDQ